MTETCRQCSGARRRQVFILTHQRVKGDFAEDVTFQQLCKSQVSWVEMNDQYTQYRGSKLSTRKGPLELTLC